MREFDEVLVQYGILAKNAQKSIGKDRISVFGNAIIETIDFKILQESGILELKIRDSEIFQIDFTQKNNINIHLEQCSIKSQINARELSFTNEFNFIECTFNESVRFSDSDFYSIGVESQVNFEKSIFKSYVFFDRAKFKVRVNFSETTFEKKVVFDDAVFLYQNFEMNDIEVNFAGAVFKNIANFRDIQFISMVDFSFAIFENDVCFCDTDFQSVTHFSSVQFKNKCDFSSTKFSVICKKEESYRLLFNNINFEDVVDFNSATFESGVFFEGSLFKNKVYFKSAKFLTSLYNAEINNFENIIFKDDVLFDNVVFESSVLFNKCRYDGKIYMQHAVINQRIVFYETLFLGSVYFSNSEFYNYVDFHQCEFEKTASFYGVRFDKTPNFSQAVFKGNLNIVNTNLNFIFDDLERKIEHEYKSFNKDTNEQDEKSLDEFANDFRDSFRNFKSTLIKDNNLLDASNFHKYELYCKEIELKNKKGKTFKDVVDKYQLFFYRKLCDHHTDLLKVFHNLLIIIMLFSIFSFVLDKFKQPSIENHAKYHIIQVDTNESYIFKEHNKTTYNFLSLNIEQEFKNLDSLLSKTEIYFSLGFILLVTFVALLNKQYLWFLLLPLFVGVVYCIEFPMSIITHFMIIMLFACTFVFIMVFDSKPERFLFVSVSYIVCIFALLAKPSLMLPVFGSFLEKDSNATYPLLLSLSVVYFILVALVIFSLQKTARKNSIVPS
ncbi:pentapeptide repeat-containing protein [Campylobacter lari]